MCATGHTLIERKQMKTSNTKSKLTSLELRDEIIGLLNAMHEAHSSLFYKSQHISVVFTCTPTKLWMYEIYIHGESTGPANGAEFTYQGIKAHAAMVLAVVAAACNQSLPTQAAPNPEGWN
jgi:hypothetical protein